MLRRLVSWSNELMHHPLRVFWICLALGAVGVILDGTALRLWSLHRDHKVITERIEAAHVRSRQLAFRIQEAQQPAFIERAARDQFDFVKEGDLIFIFSDEKSEPVENSEDSLN